MKSKILVVNGHPAPNSFCSALAQSYIDGVVDSNADVQYIDLSKAQFDPVLKYGYQQEVELEPQLLEAQKLIQWAEHLVFVYPNWWGFMPAIMKGFFDRTLLPRFAFKYRKNSPYWDKLLSGKTAHLIITSDTPAWYNILAYQRAGEKVIVRNILKFCGIKTKRISNISPIRGSSGEQREQWLRQAYRYGLKRL